MAEMRLQLEGLTLEYKEVKAGQRKIESLGVSRINFLINVVKSKSYWLPVDVSSPELLLKCRRSCNVAILVMLQVLIQVFWGFFWTVCSHLLLKSDPYLHLLKLR